MKKKLIKRISLSILFASGIFSLAGCKKGLYGNKGDYDVIFNSNGLVINKITVSWGNEFTLPADPIRSGYTFKGWYLDSEFTKPLTDYKVTENINLYAKWEINSYKVTFNSNGGSNIDSISGEYKSKITPLSPTREGYAFKGWYLDSEFTTEYDNLIHDKDITVYAKWQANQCIITFNKNASDALNNMSNITIPSGGNIALSENLFERNGYTFKGWSTSSTGDVEYKDKEVLETVPAGNLTLYAVWEINKYDVNFVFIDELYDSVNLEYNSNIPYPSTSPSLDNYTFKGWGTYVPTKDTIFNGKKIYYNQAYQVIDFIPGTNINSELYELEIYSGKVKADTNFNLYAIFERNEFDVNYYAFNEVIHSDKCYYNTLLNVFNKTYEGYTFDGWYTDNEYNNKFIYDNSASKISGNTNLFGKYVANKYDIEFIDASNLDNINASYDEKITLPKGIKDGYEFIGWATSNNGEVIYHENDEINVPLNGIKLYAIYEAIEVNYRVNHHLENLDGTYSLAGYETLSDYTAKLTNASARIYPGFIDKDFSQKEISGDSSTVIDIYYDREIYSVKFVDSEGALLKELNVKYKNTCINTLNSIESFFFKDDYKAKYSLDFKFDDEITSSLTITVTYVLLSQHISFNTNGGTSIEAIEANIGENITKPADPTKTGYTFDNWYSDINLTVPFVFPTVMPEESFTIYAKWTINKYDLKVYYNNDLYTDINTSYDYNTSISQYISTPSLKGYKFVGWYTDSSFDNYFDLNDDTVLTDNLTIYAKYEPITIKVTFNNPTLGEDNKTYNFTYNTNFTMPSDFSKTGYSLKWVLDLYNDITYDINDVITFDSSLFDNICSLNGGEITDISFTPKYTINQYTYTFNTPNQDPIKYTLDYLSSISIPNPSNYTDGKYIYIFAGWIDDSTSMVVETPTFIDASSKSFTAKFNKKEATIKYLNRKDGILIYSTNSTKTNEGFNDYIKEVYDKYNAYLFIDKALKNVIEYNASEQLVPGSGDPSLMNEITAINVYIGYLAQRETANAYIWANVLSQASIDQATYDILVTTNPEQASQILAAYNTYVDTDGFITGSGLIAVASNYSINISDLDMANTCSKAIKAIALTNDSDYLNLLLSENLGSKIEVAANNTTDKLTIYSDLYFNYEANAYYPYTSDSKIFDGFGYDVNYDSQIITNYAKWITKPLAPTNIRISKITSSTIDLTWKEISNIYEYRVYVYNGNTLRDTLKTSTNNISISVIDGESIKVKIVAVPASNEGLMKENSTEFSNISLADGKTLKLNSVSLVSDESLPFNYIHTVSSEQNISSSGDYYYVGESGKLYLFANSSYQFSNFENIVITSGNDLASYSDGKLYTSNMEGNIEFDAYRKDGEVEHRSAHIGLLIESIDYGENLHNFDYIKNNILSSDYQNKATPTYLIGSSVINNSSLKYTDYNSYEFDGDIYYNGFKFDFIANTSINYQLDSSMVDFDYKFKDLSTGNIITDTSSLFVYDDENDVFYFLVNEGEYEVTVSFKKDGYYKTKDLNYDATKTYYTYNDGNYVKFNGIEFDGETDYYEYYVNIALPNAYKSNNYSRKLTFILNNGINVYTDEALKKAYSDKNTSNINLHSTIQAKLSPNMVSYIAYSRTGDLDYGELDIAEGSAIMTKEDGYSPKIWAMSPSKPSGVFSFKASDGNYYYYQDGGSYAIKDCLWVENYNHGAFKINHKSMTNTSYAAYGYISASIYQRSNTTTDCSINGNYFTIDGSKLPFIQSEGHVTMGGTIAAYEIQHVNVSIFQTIAESNSSFNNLEIICNTMDASNYLAHNEASSISDYMSKTSGGYNAIRSLSPSGSYVDLSKITENNPLLTNNEISLDNVIIKNSLIAIYADYYTTANINYTYIDESWANSLFSCGGGFINIKNSKVKASGGASYHVEDINYVYGNTNYTLNPELYVDYSTTTTDNLVSGEEQWFKAYSMEVLALGMKSQLEAGINQVGQALSKNFTILKVVKDPVTKLETEKMNFVFLSKTDSIKEQVGLNKIDLTVELLFGTPYQVVNENTTVYLNGNNAPIIVNVTPVGASNKLITVTDSNQNVLHRYFTFVSGVDYYEIYGMIEVYEK